MSIKNILTIWILLCTVAIGSMESGMWDRIREGGTLAWAVHYTGQDQNDLTSYDKFASIAIDKGEDIWVAVVREVNDVNYCYIEKFKSLDWYQNEDINDAWFVDCAGDERQVWHSEVDAVDGNDGGTTYGDYTEFFVGYAPTSLPLVPVVKATSDSNVNTDWGDSGYWTSGDANSAYSRDAVQLDDGRLLVPVANGRVYMVNTDGTTDTTWGNNGYYDSSLGMTTGVNKILVDNDGNFHLFGGVADTDGETPYKKISADGTTLLATLTKGTAKIWSYTDAQWSDDTKTRIIASGSAPTGFYIDEAWWYPGIIAINPVDGSIDTSWDGNIAGQAGFCAPNGANGSTAIYNIRITSDGGIICHNNSTTANDFLFKVLPDGSGLDTNWGTNGRYEATIVQWGYGDAREMDNYGDEIFVNARQTVDGNTRCVLHHIDEDGVVVNTQVIADSSQYTYTMLQCFNDKLILGGFADDNIEIWSQDLVKESGFDIAYEYYAITWVIPDESTRETEVIPPTEGTPAVPAYWETIDVNYSRLENRYACVYADTNSEGSYLITDSNLTGIDPNDYTNFLAGLNYYSIYESFPITPSKQPTRVTRIALDLYQTMGLNLGVDMDNSSELDFNGLYTGYKIAEFPRGNSREPVIYLYEWYPLPFTLRGIYIREETTLE